MDMSELDDIKARGVPMSENIVVDIDSPVLFGRGIWHINGETVMIECPGWYLYRNGHWTWVEVEIEEIAK